MCIYIYIYTVTFSGAHQTSHTHLCTLIFDVFFLQLNPPTWSKQQTLIHHGCMRPEDTSHHDQSQKKTAVDGRYNLFNMTIYSK